MTCYFGIGPVALAEIIRVGMNNEGASQEFSDTKIRQSVAIEMARAADISQITGVADLGCISSMCHS